MKEEDNIEEQEELYEHYHYVADKGQEKLRIDKFLMDRIPNTSRNKIQIAAHNGNILVNKEKVKPNYKVKPLDDISIAVKPEDKFQNGDDMPMSIDYTQLISVLIKAVQEASAKIATLETKITNLENGN